MKVIELVKRLQGYENQDAEVVITDGSTLVAQAEGDMWMVIAQLPFEESDE